MRRILITVIIVVFAASVNAQTGMPKELSCTETAFNFSFSFGNNWKFVAPKMGPVEVTNNEPGNFPVWLLKTNNPAPETPVLPLYSTKTSDSQNYNPASSAKSVKAFDVSKYLLPEVNFDLPQNYTLLKLGSVKL